MFVNIFDIVTASLLASIVLFSYAEFIAYSFPIYILTFHIDAFVHVQNVYCRSHGYLLYTDNFNISEIIANNQKMCLRVKLRFFKELLLLFY